MSRNAMNARTLTDRELWELVRSAHAVLNGCNGEDWKQRTEDAVERLRGAVEKNCHLGATTWCWRKSIEWYAGQILDIVDERKWFAVNSWINCVDKFAPEPPNGI